jgi:hypothetical protein
VLPQNLSNAKNSRSARRRKVTPDRFTVGLHRVHVDKLIPSPENRLLYRPRTSADADRRRLVKSIRDKKGVQTPLLVSRDGFIVSGHERHCSAPEAGYPIVPIIVLDLRRCDCSRDEWLAILREHNTGRQKTLNELICEKMVDVAVVETAGQVVDSLVTTSDVTSPTIYVPEHQKKRSPITEVSRGFADAILHILNKGDLKGINVNERAIHYRLLPPLNVRTSTRSDGFIYGAPGKEKESIAALSRMLTRLRLTGEVPWERIIDDTRPVAYWKTYADAAEFIEIEIRELFTGFARDLVKSQEDDYVIVAEKLTVKSFVDRVAARYTIPTVILRGNSGIDARYQVARRFMASGKRNLVLFILSDCDPAGDMIAETTVHSLRDEFNIPDVQAIRVAFTHSQADKFGLSANPGLVCKDSSVAPKFIERHGRNDCYELEAVSPQILQSMLDEAIRANINVDLYNAEVRLQDRDNAAIEVRRQIVRQAIVNDTKLDLSNFDSDDADEGDA